MNTPRERLENKTRKVLYALDQLAYLSETDPAPADVRKVELVLFKRLEKTITELHEGPTQFALEPK